MPSSSFGTRHDVTRFDIPVNQLLFVYRSQPGGDLRHDLQRQLYLQLTGASDEFFERFSLYELHRIEVTASGFAKVEDRRNIRVTNARRCTGFTQKAKPRRFITKVSLANDFQCHGTTQIERGAAYGDHRSR